MKKIGMIGILPPPYGGRATYFKKLYENISEIYGKENIDLYLLNKKSSISTNFKFYNIKSVIWHILTKKYKIIHTNDENYKYIFILGLLKKITKTKLILTHHSVRYNPEEFNKIKFFIFRKAINSVDLNMVVGNKEFKILSQYIKLQQSVMEVSPYIESLQKTVKPLQKTIEQGSLIFGWNGAIRFYENKDIYGLDLCVKSFCNLKEKFPNIKLVLAILDFKNDLIAQSYLEEKIKNVPKNIMKDIEIIADGMEPNIFRNKIDVLLRPNYSDSFGLSVIECLNEGIPVIASDVCIRPKGCRTFSNRNELELENELHYMMNHYKEIYNEISKNNYKGSLKEILKIYEYMMK